MILDELYTKIEHYSGYSKNISDEKAKMLNVINTTLKEFYNEFNLKSTIMDNIFKTKEDVYVYYLDAMANKILNMSIISGQSLDCVSRDIFEKHYNTISTKNQPTIYIPLGRVYVANQPENISYINVVSSNNTDNSKVLIKGISGDDVISEEVTLDGTTPVQSQNQYSYVISISKPVTNGVITASAGTTQLIKLQNWETSREYIKVRLYPTPDKEYDIVYSFYPKSFYIQFDSDVIPLPDRYLNAFENCILARLFLQQGSNLADKWVQLAELSKMKLQEMDSQSEEETPDFTFEEFLR